MSDTQGHVGSSQESRRNRNGSALAHTTSNSSSSKFENQSRNARNADTDEGESATSTMGEISRAAKDMYNQATDVVSQKVDQLKEQGEQVLRTAEGSIARNPMTAIGVALGVGVLCGLGFTSLFRRDA